MLFCWVLAGCLIAAGRFLQLRRNYIFCMVAAGFACLQVPLGTVLGVFTIIVLQRPEVKRMFEQRSPVLEEEEPEVT
jgi:hypothetical protein